MSEKQTKRREKSRDVERRSPGTLWLRLECIKANSTPIIDIWVEDGCQETDFGGFKRVAGGDFQLETEEAGGVGRAFGALNTWGREEGRGREGNYEGVKRRTAIQGMEH